MAEYIGIKGSTIQTIAGDPANPIEGQVWYNSTTTVLKGSGTFISGGAWASGGNVNTALQNLGGCGIQTAAIKFGGYDPGGNKTIMQEFWFSRYSYGKI